MDLGLRDILSPLYYLRLILCETNEEPAPTSHTTPGPDFAAWNESFGDAERGGGSDDGGGGLPIAWCDDLSDFHVTNPL